jgi:hypothetical protein
MKERIIGALFALGSLAGAAWSGGTAPAVTLPAREQFHIYLLFGQSNMAGRGKLEENRPVHPRVLKLTAEHTWAPATEPLHFDVPRICGAGIGTTFAEDMADANPAVTIGLVPCAYSGSPLDDWRKGAIRYEDAVVRARAAMKDGVLKGILWHQGETDAGQEALATSYLDRISRAIAEWRAALDQPALPVVAGKICDCGAVLVADGKPRYPFARVVNEALEQLPAKVPHTAVADSRGLTDKGDRVHFDTPALREFGHRYAKAMLSLRGAQPGR